MRVLALSGYTHAVHHRKMELLADAPDVDLLHILPPGNGKAPGRHPSADGRRTYAVHVLPLRSLGRADDPHRLFHWPPDFQLARFRPSMIYCEHEPESLMALEVALARRLNAPRAPLIWYTWQNVARPRRPWVRWLTRATLRAARHVVCANRQAIQVLRADGFRGDCTVMPLTGVDARYIAPRPAEAQRASLGLGGCVVGYLGRLVPEKGVDVLLRAVQACPAPVSVLIVGDGPEKARLQALAAQLALGDRCRFLPAVPYDEVPNYLSALDMLVLPSRTTPRWKEQFGRVLAEAMACRVAVIGAESGAIPEVIHDAGRTFPEGDVAALAGVLAELAGDDAQRRALAERGYQRARALYSVETLAGQLLDVWRRCAS